VHRAIVFDDGWHFLTKVKILSLRDFLLPIWFLGLVELENQFVLVSTEA
jgi:hypothetical protein